MNEVQYQIAFMGKLRPGFDQEKVKANLQEHLKLSSTVVESLFAKDRVVIKRNLNVNVAKQYEQRFYMHGAIVKLEQQLEAKAQSETSIKPISSESRSAADLSIEPIAASSNSLGSEPVKGANVDHGGMASNSGGAVNTDDEYPKTLPFEFTGNGKEYFKIWIVNIALTILTLGIYSAWAKVRNKQYFYGNTLFEGSSFEYTAQPLTILKGRILAFGVIGLYYVLATFLPPAYAIGFYLLAFVIVIFLLPWVVIKALQFNARHSQYRNINFGFDGSYWGSFTAFILWPMASIFFVLLPFSWHRKNEFFVANSRYGTTPFQFTANVNDYYGLFGKMILLVIVSLIVMGLFIAAIAFGFGASGGVESFGEASYAPVAIGIVSSIGYMLLYFVGLAFYEVLSNNLLYNNTLINEHSLSADYKFGSFLSLLITNTLGILFTLGLFIPWASVRSARYHAEHTQFIATQSLDSFVAGEEQKVNTFSEGLADAHSVFDLDVGI